MPPSAPRTGAAVCLGPAFLPWLVVPVVWLATVPEPEVLELLEPVPVVLGEEVVVAAVVSVVVAEAELSAGVELLLPVDEVVGLAPPGGGVELHDTVLGTLTCWAWQICWAKSMAFCWSAASHCWTRQHEMADMKPLSEQMQVASRPQLPMPPLRKMLAQDILEGRELVGLHGGGEGEGKSYRAGW
jgi:hypothetical protein